MPSDKVSSILKSKTDLGDDEIDTLSEVECWRLVYDLGKQEKSRRIISDQICFTGFSPSDKEKLSSLAKGGGLEVVKSVTKSLTYLCAGMNAGPSKLKKAGAQETLILSRDELLNLLETGEIPMHR